MLYMFSTDIIIFQNIFGLEFASTELALDCLYVVLLTTCVCVCVGGT